MTVHWITFRIADKTVGGKSYDERYDALIEAIKGHRLPGHWWHDPTSFWLVSSNSTRMQIAASVKKAISISTDLVVIGSVEHTGVSLVGKAENLETLKKIVPGLTEH